MNTNNIIGYVAKQTQAKQFKRGHNAQVIDLTHRLIVLQRHTYYGLLKLNINRVDS